MLVLLGFVLLMLLLLFFIVGITMLRDIKLVHLMIDSLDAEDFLMLFDEGQRLRSLPRSSRSEMVILYEKFADYIRRHE